MNFKYRIERAISNILYDDKKIECIVKSIIATIILIVGIWLISKYSSSSKNASLDTSENISEPSPTSIVTPQPSPMPTPMSEPTQIPEITTFQYLNDIRRDSVRIGQYHYAILCTYTSKIDLLKSIENTKEYDNLYREIQNTLGDTYSKDMIYNLSYDEQRSFGLCYPIPIIFNSESDASDLCTLYRGDIVTSDSKEDWQAYSYFLKKYPSASIAFKGSGESNSSYLIKWSDTQYNDTPSWEILNTYIK